MPNEVQLLLDTHVWLWSQAAPAKLRPSIAAGIDTAADQGTLFVSVISVWEIALLEQRKRIQLQNGVLQWSRKALQTPGINLIPFSPEIAIESVNLPAPMHKDPADRILVATGRVEGLTLVTADKAVIAFARASGMPYLRA